MLSLVQDSSDMDINFNLLQLISIYYSFDELWVTSDKWFPSLSVFVLFLNLVVISAGHWDSMEEYTCMIPRDTHDGAFYRAVLALHQDLFSLAQQVGYITTYKHTHYQWFFSTEWSLEVYF